MNRLHLFEFCDKAWLPGVVRDFITDQLHFVMTAGEIYQPVLRVLHRTLRLNGESRIVDLCSGGGGPFPWLAERMQEDYRLPVQVTLTDLYPRDDAKEAALETDDGQIVYRREPTNALDVPDELKGVRTLFSSLHHFRPPQVVSLFRDAVSKRQPIATFELLRRDGLSIFHMVVYAILSSILLTPRIGRLSASRLLFTYVLPIAPFCYIWDGIVSCLRMHSPEELRSIVAQLPPNDYEWEIGEIVNGTPFGPLTFFGPLTITYLIGIPARSAAPSFARKVSAAHEEYEGATRSWKLAMESLKVASRDLEEAIKHRNTRLAELRKAIQELNEQLEEEQRGPDNDGNHKPLEKRGPVFDGI